MVLPPKLLSQSQALCTGYCYIMPVPHTNYGSNKPVLHIGFGLIKLSYRQEGELAYFSPKRFSEIYFSGQFR